MENGELANLLEQAASEITGLRRRNEVLTAQVFVVEAFAAALKAEPARQVFGEDVAYKLRKAIESLANPAKDPVQEGA